jgi:hypothetical protein
VVFGKPQSLFRPSDDLSVLHDVVPFDAATIDYLEMVTARIVVNVRDLVGRAERILAGQQTSTDFSRGCRACRRFGLVRFNEIFKLGELLLEFPREWVELLLEFNERRPQALGLLQSRYWMYSVLTDQLTQAANIGNLVLYFENRSFC